MSIEIREVLTKKEKLKWVRFPTKLYKGNEFFVPFLEMDELDTFSSEKNPAYAFCETRLFLAYKDGSVAGRIAGLINHAYNKKWGKNAIRFTRFDFIDDKEVSRALFDSVVLWGKERGFTEIMGPIGFTDMDHEGMLVEGFDEFNMSITFYNHPYYLDHMESLGLKKDIDWIEYKLSVPDKLDPTVQKISDRLVESKGFKVVTYNDRKVLYKDALEAFKVIDYICAVRNPEDKIVGFGVMVPSIAKALKKSDGRAFPFGIFRLLKALKGKNDTLEMYFVAVDPTYQRQGVPAIIITTLLKKLIENGVRICETGPMLETNTAVHSLWKPFEKRQHKRRRCFIKAI